VSRSTVDRDYILGTTDQETLRLGIQHESWLPLARACWERAGVSPGDRVIDVGAGPGFAALDLAAIVGESGHVTAVERSARFVEAGKEMARGRGISNIDFLELDLMTDELPAGAHDVAWCRWVASFVDSPAALVDKLARVVGPGGVAVFHEYADYGSWRYAPTRPLLDEYIGRVMHSWRSAGGEPDVATAIPAMLAERGFTIELIEPRVFCVGPRHPLWTWISTFVESNLGRLVELRQCDEPWADSVRSELRDAQSNPATLMITPMVLEIIARKDGSSD